MSLIDILAATRSEMGLVQLCLLFLAVTTYSLAINGSFGSSARSGAASLSFAAAVGFSALTPSWAGAIVLLAIAVLMIATFAGAAWVVSALLGLGAQRPAPLFDGEPRVTAPMSLPQAVPGLVARVVRF